MVFLRRIRDRNTLAIQLDEWTLGRLLAAREAVQPARLELTVQVHVGCILVLPEPLPDGEWRQQDETVPHPRGIGACTFYVRAGEKKAYPIGKGIITLPGNATALVDLPDELWDAVTEAEKERFVRREAEKFRKEIAFKLPFGAAASVTYTCEETGATFTSAREIFEHVHALDHDGES